MTGISSGQVRADEVDCGSLDNADWGNVGPWDYYDRGNWVPTADAPQTRIKLVENVHFKRQWEYFGPKTPAITVANEVGYTLRLFPNHPRALWTMSRLERQRGPLNKYYSSPVIPRVSTDCFFDRAVRFRPQQAPTWMIYGMHLHATKRLKDAREAYETAEKLGEASAQFHYNYGLLLVDLGDLDTAESHARQAYAKGYQLQGLKDKLKQRGRDIQTEK
jgi:tetratricopeptide (TPR) repeat protein